MAFPGSIYAPPGVYTQTLFEDPLRGLAASVRLPLILGVGSEILFQDALELVRGSSASVDQRIVQEDEAGRAVVSINSETGAVTIGNFDGELTQLQTKKYPIVKGNGTGTTATDASSVSVTVNGDPVVVLSIDGTKGVLKLSVAPEATDEVRVTYYFKRTDTLITDTLSDQITSTGPEIYGGVGQNYTIETDVNDTLEFTVDSSDTVSVLIEESPSGGWTAAQVAAFINSAASGTTLSATTATNNFGHVVLYLTADRGIKVGSGTANTDLGLTAGLDTSRNKVFYTFQTPIVDGSNGGVTSTDPADVTVKVDGTQVIPTSVDGQTGAVTLAFAPEVGAVVTCQYYFNAWQDTFDYLAHRNVTDITLCGLTPDRNDYTDGADFVLKDDRILWGTAVLVEAGEHTTGSEYFDDTQVSTTLVDTRQYFGACEEVASTNRKQFTLSLVPTTGNGRDTPLSSTVFADVSNGRIDLPTNRPDLVYMYWGYSVSDAMDRGRVEVTGVDSDTSTVTLRESVPVGASVFATFYYNTLVDMEYTLSCETDGGSGTGTYGVVNEDGTSVLTPTFGSKSAGLATITVEFPSGSERTPDCRIESVDDTTYYVGPVEEDVTVTFAAQDATLAKYAIPGTGPYYVITDESDNLDINLDNTGATTYDLSDPTTAGTGFRAYLVGDEVEYASDSTGGGTTFAITAADSGIDLWVDGVQVNAVAVEGATQDISDFSLAVNSAAFGDYSVNAAGATALTTQGAGTSDTEFQLDTTANGASAVDDYYVGWTVRIVTATGTAVVGDEATVTAYTGSTNTVTVGSGMSGITGAGDEYVIYNPDTLPKMLGATRFLAAVSVGTGGFDEIDFRYVGDVIGSTGTVVATVTAGSYPSASTLAAVVETQMNTALAGGAGVTAGVGPKVVVTANTSSQLVIKLIPDASDLTGGYLEFVTGGAAEDDFCVMAGIDTDTAGGSQTKLYNGAIASTFSFAATPLVHDRLILQSRLLPSDGTGTLDAECFVDQTQLKVMAGTGNTLAALTDNENGLAGIRATVMEPTIFGEVGFDGGQDAVDNPIVTFYAAGGTEAQNNIFKFSFDGVPVSVTFTDGAGTTIASAGSADVPLSDPSGAATDPIITQIAQAMAATVWPVEFAAGTVTATTVITAGYVRQEGAGIRFRSASSAASASIVIGEGNASEILGFPGEPVAYRTTLAVEVLVSALMSNSTFTTDGIARTLRDAANAEYLFVQSRGAAGAGTTSSVVFEDSTSDSALRPGTGLGLEDGDGNVGEDAVDGFFVTSSDTVSGSGTADTSRLNVGTGQDGNVGQTYRDLVTGLAFSILPRAGGGSYPAGATVSFSVRASVTTDSNLPVNTIPGVELTVSNTLDVGVGDTAVVTTYEKGGNQPSVGDVYYASYEYTKQDYTTGLFTKLSSVEAAYGATNPNNPVSLAAYLAFLNGAVLLAVKQIQKDTDTNADGSLDSASETAFLTAIDDVEGVTPGGLFPDILVPLKGDSLELFQYLARHCDIQSSIRYRAERTAICGLGAGTQPRDAGDIAEAVARSRLRIVYPDIITLSISRVDGGTDSYLLDGTYMAAAFAGNRAAPSIDVATPWTRARIFGFDEVARTLDAVEQNQVAVRGVTVFGQRNSIIECRQGLTTDMTNVLTKTPTVMTIADEVQRQARATLDQFIGIKFLSTVTGSIEGQLSATLKQMVRNQIIAGFTGVAASVSEEDPTVAEVEAFYQPVFPLLYIVITFNLRTSL